MKLCFLALAASAVARPYGGDGGDDYSPATVCYPVY
jgi:hypothetical protein